MTDPITTIENALHHAGKTVNRRGNRIMAQCPAPLHMAGGQAKHIGGA